MYRKNSNNIAKNLNVVKSRLYKKYIVARGEKNFTNDRIIE